MELWPERHRVTLVQADTYIHKILPNQELHKHSYAIGTWLHLHEIKLECKQSMLGLISVLRLFTTLHNSEFHKFPYIQNDGL
jgi:hypothetical protein